MPTVTLRSASSWVVLLPEAGGAIARYASRRGARSYDWLCPGDAQRPAAFPMVPFCSRIRDGRFPFAGRLIELPANLPPQRHAIHGHGWQSSWVVRARSERAAVLEYRHAADAWPWTYVARQEFSLDDDRLCVALSVRNTAEAPMPVGFGLHPYFSCTPGARIQARVAECWEMDSQVLPVRPGPLLEGQNLPQGITAAERVLDNIFTNWDGHFSVRWPEWEAALTVRAAKVFGHLVVYTPAREAFFCVEPVSNITDAFNMLARGETGHGALVLEPGNAVRGSVEFSPSYG